MRRLLRPLLILLALVLLFEAWLWRGLQPIVAWIVDRIAWKALKLRAAAAIRHLPPAATLMVFLLPILVLLPVKIVGVWMLAHGSWLGAMATLAVAKVLSMGLMAFIFDVTRPKLLQLRWFRWLYDHVIVWLEKAHALIDPVKAALHAFVARQLAPLRHRAAALFGPAKPKRAGRFMRRLAWLRRRAERA